MLIAFIIRILSYYCNSAKKIQEHMQLFITVDIFAFEKPPYFKLNFSLVPNKVKKKSLKIYILSILISSTFINSKK